MIALLKMTLLFKFCTIMEEVQCHSQVGERRIAFN